MMNGSDEQPPADDAGGENQETTGESKFTVTTQADGASDDHHQQQGDNDENPSPSAADRDQAFSHLQESSVKLGNKLKEVTQEVDKKIGISQSLAQIGTKVQEVDQEHHVTENVTKSVAEVGSSLTNWWKSVDAACGISNATQKMSSAIKETVIDPAAPHLQRTWSVTQQKLQNLDEQHKITTKTASALASGADFIAKSLDGQHPATDADPNAPAETATSPTATPTKVDDADRSNPGGSTSH